MSAITQYRRQSTSLLHRVNSAVSGMINGFTAPGRPATRRPQGQSPQAVPTSEYRWLQPLTPPGRLAFQTGSKADNKAQQTMLIWLVQQVETNSPAAALAIMDFLAKQTSEIQGFAHAERTRLLTTVYPTEAARYSAKTGKKHLRDIDGQQTNELSYLEVTFLGLVHGTKWSNGIDLRQLIRGLTELAIEFAGRGEQKRAASARFILADLYLQRGQTEIATRELGKAIVLASVAYTQRDEINRPDELLAMTKHTLGNAIVDETYQDAPHEMQTHVRDLVGS